VIAVGVGFGIDYGIYILSRVQERTAAGMPLDDAVRDAIGGAGRTVAFTALTMTAGISASRSPSCVSWPRWPYCSRSGWRPAQRRRWSRCLRHSSFFGRGSWRHGHRSAASRRSGICAYALILLH
jgi:hypothetical protein